MEHLLVPLVVIAALVAITVRVKLLAPLQIKTEIAIVRTSVTWDMSPGIADDG